MPKLMLCHEINGKLVPLDFLNGRLYVSQSKPKNVLGCCISVCVREKAFECIKPCKTELSGGFFAAAGEGFTQVSFLQPVFRGELGDVEYVRLKTSA